MMLAFAKKYALPHWRLYLIGAVTLGISNLIMLEIPQLAKSIINSLSTSGDNLSTMAQTALFIVGLGFLQIGMRTLSRVTIFWPGRKLEAGIKQDLFDKLLSLPQKFFDNYGMGDLISRVTNDTGHLRVFFAFSLLQIMNMAYLGIFTISKMASINPRLTAACLAPLIFMVFMTRYFMPKMHQYSTLTQEAIGRLTNQVTEAYVNIHTIKANAAHGNFFKKLAAINQDVYLANIKLIGIRTIVFPLIGSLASVSQIIILFYGGYLVINNLLSIGDILAFNIYINLMSFPLTAIGITIATYQRAKVALERIAIIEDAQSEKSATLDYKDDAAASKAPKEHATYNHKGVLIKESFVGALSLKHLNYEFHDKKSAKSVKVLDDISLNVAPGKKVGIFGTIGSGKSTLLNLIAAVYVPPTGTIFFSGDDICNWDPQALRRKIVYVTQKAQLFSDSIRNNLIFGLEDSPGEQQCIEAAKQADIYKDIIDFPNQWDCEIGEQGIKLSGGQKQRLALARAFIRRPEILLLDDVLSALDQQTEQNILQEIYRIGCTLIITSHRSSALAQCDEILVLDSGKIIQRGSYAELAGYFKEVEQSDPHPPIIVMPSLATGKEGV